MRIYIVIPAHNEVDFIEATLHSLVTQTLLPKRIVVVDDHSTDGTPARVQKYLSKFDFIHLVQNPSENTHLPGSKVIQAFYKGFETLDQHFDLICKFDADLIFPENYLQEISTYFQKDEKVGMAGGACSIEKDGKWILENLTDNTHLRGALKAYRKPCFNEIGGLKPSMGWDTVDELLAQYHGWKIKVDPNLQVKHLRLTGFTYNKKAKLKQGQAFYKLRYGFFITCIASAKLCFKKGKPQLFVHYLHGYWNAKSQRLPYLVSKKEGAFIRRLRYKKMLAKLWPQKQN